MIKIKNLSIRAGEFRLNALSLVLAPGEYGMLMGKTGSGKTTILECVCGLRPIDGGKIELAGEDVTSMRPAERGIGYVPQEGAMFPNMTVRAHLAFPLKIRKWPRVKIEERTNELAEMLAITSLLDRFPRRLSGGEVQRVALGRALAFRPKLLLLDEPLSALDETTRSRMYDVLRSVRCNTSVTTLHVTHNREEADSLADAVFQLDEGRIAVEKGSGKSRRSHPGREVTS